MKKLLSILFILTFCLMAIAAPAMAQLTFQSEPQSQPEGLVMTDSGLGDGEVTEAELANARMTLEMVAKSLEDFSPSEMYASLSELPQFSEFIQDFWKPDMTAEMKNFLFTMLKPEISNLDNGSFLEDTLREAYTDEKAKAEFGKSGVEWISENSFNISGFMTMTVTGNTYVYTDATGKEIQRIALSTGPVADSILVKLDQNLGDKPTSVEFLMTFEGETILISTKDESSSEFGDASRISFDETNLIKMTNLKDNSVIEIRFVPETYEIKLNTPETVSAETGMSTPAAEYVFELNPDKDLIGLAKDGEKIIEVFFYPADKEVSIVSAFLAELTESMGGTSSITLKFDDASQTIDVSSGEASLLKLGFNDATSSIDISFNMGGDAGMMSGLTLAVDSAAKKVSFTMMGMEMFSLVLDVDSETAVMNSLDMMTMENEEMVMTIEDIAIFLRGTTSASPVY